MERRHRYIVETLTMMFATGLSQELWYNACAHVMFLINKMPSRTLLMIFLALYDKNPTLQDLGIFGSAIFPYQTI